MMLFHMSLKKKCEASLILFTLSVWNHWQFLYFEAFAGRFKEGKATGGKKDRGMEVDCIRRRACCSFQKKKIF